MGTEKKTTKKAPIGGKPAKIGRPRLKISAEVYTILETGDTKSGTVTTLCKLLGISGTVFYKWMEEEPEFKQAVIRVRENADDMVEDAFFRRALGFDYTETIDKMESTPQGEKVSNQVASKHVPTDPGAALNWLKNRRRGKWTEKVEVAVTGSHVDLVEKFLRGELK